MREKGKILFFLAAQTWTADREVIG